MGFTIIDYLIIVIYLLAIPTIGIWAAGSQKNTTDYFMGGREMPWWAVLFSIVATETSTLTFISVPAVSYGGNLTFLQITLGYITGRILVSFIFLPAYYKGNLSTAYQFLANRFGSSMRNITSTTFMVTRLLADGVRLFATAIPLAILLRLGGMFSGWSDYEIYISAITVIALITIIYTFFGGIKAVVWIDVIQMSVYIVGALIAAAIILFALPDGLTGVIDYTGSSNKLDFIYLGWDLSWREFLDQPYTLITAILGGAVFSLASHGTDQLIVQRLFTTGTLSSARKALIGSGFVIFLQFTLFLGIGLLLFAFYDGQSAGQLNLATTDEIFPKFILEEVPTGISGLIVAALLAAAMSSLSSSLNSLASSTTLDLYKPYLGKNNSASQDLKVSRIFTVTWGVILTGAAYYFAWLQLSATGERPAVVELGLGIASYTYGGLLGTFLLGKLSQTVNRLDATIGFFTGLLTLLFMVEGPVQDLLPGDPVAIAWPLYTLVGTIVVIVVGQLSYYTRKLSPSS